jgi:hypothetical protein
LGGGGDVLSGAQQGVHEVAGGVELCGGEGVKEGEAQGGEGLFIFTGTGEGFGEGELPGGFLGGQLGSGLEGGEGLGVALQLQEGDAEPIMEFWLIGEGFEGEVEGF